MLYVKTKVKIDGRISHPFNTGSGKEYLRELLRIDVKDVESIQADNDELEAVRAQFDNLPFPKSRVVCWRGDLAHLIFDHLKL